jgi:hypothetical protein
MKKCYPAWNHALRIHGLSYAAGLQGLTEPSYHSSLTVTFQRSTVALTVPNLSEYEPQKEPKTVERPGHINEHANCCNRICMLDLL